MIAYAGLKAAIIANLEIDSTDFTKFNGDANLLSAQDFILNFLASNINRIDHSILDNEIRNTLTKLKGTESDPADATEYQWPNDYRAFYKGWVSYSGAITISNPGKQLTLYDPDKHMLNIQDLASQNYPFIDLDLENGYAIYPAATAEVAKGIKLSYLWKMLAPTSTQDCQLNSKWRNLMIFKATALCAAVEEYRPEMAKDYEAKAMDEIRAITKIEEKK